jgi:hypothetical protein
MRAIDYQFKKGVELTGLYSNFERPAVLFARYQVA